ncbi:hypothetical protein B0H13DRAFT_2085070 [Mycena leptocephala]|nr:hypothetical protein B0H13DRAFT_2085070 [Mycena leptocephala]
MFKKYKAFLNNEGKFEQPGARALQDFIKAAEQRVREAEEQAEAAEARAVVEALAPDISSLRTSIETITRERLFPQRAPPPTKPLPKRGSPTCSICFALCSVCPNPWQRTRSDLMVSKVSDIDPQLIPYGIALKPCDHVFCGVCLAQAIYHSLNMAFDSATYGTKLPSYTHDTLGPGRPEFPVSCPICRVEKGAKAIEIGDATARMVLGESNMDEWNHARFLWTLNRINCLHNGCNYTFDADDACPSRGLPPRETCVQCPRCKGPLCRTCKSLWHEGMTCLIYQALPSHELEIARKRDRRHGWAPTLHTGLHSPGSVWHSPGGSAYISPCSPGTSPYSPGTSSTSLESSLYTPETSPNSARAPPWAHEKQSFLSHT